ncbi:zinc finger and SCAN domain-containing protein 20-like [Elgaria multicarinata webbii]|uniref:zinc finger and SCAN domain-containing protein 20-like n=1 Tax=Elgaria multicarinata webbii TaxID=159646 RepID=UPI002FCCC053
MAQDFSFQTQLEPNAERDGHARTGLGYRNGTVTVLLKELLGLPLLPAEKQERGVFRSREARLKSRPEAPATPAWDNLHPPPLTQSDDIEAYLATFERVAEACSWPREEWTARLAPSLRDTAHLAYRALGACNRKDYEKLKEAVLKAYNVTAETRRRRFRQFRYPEAGCPLEVCGQLQDLCYRWLKPERHTKEHILELLVLEQFLSILPGETQNWVTERNPETCQQAVALVDGFLQKRREAKLWEEQRQELSADLQEKEPATSGPRQDLASQETGGREMVTNQNLPGSTTTPKEEETPSQENKETEEPTKSSPGRRVGDVSLDRDEEWASVLQVRLPKDLARMLQKQDRQGAGHAQVQDTDAGRGGKPSVSQEQGRIFCSQTGLLGDTTALPEERPNQCPTCRRRFSDASVLREHLKSHLAEKRYQCTECEMRFRQSSDLIKHQRIHTGEKPYQCRECGKTFSLCSALYRHHRGHSGEKPFKCKICGKGFTRNSSLAQHHRLHKQ